MKQFKKVLASALALAMVVTAIPTADAQAAAKAPKLNNTKKILYVGQSYTLKVNNLPANWKKCTYTWSTSNKSIATIKKGKYGQAASVKAVKAGKTTITTKMTYPQTAAQKKAKKKTVKTFKCAVTVKNPTLTVKASATTLAVGKTTKLSVSKAPSNAKVAFSSSDKTVATVSSNGTVKAVAPGKAVITVTSTVGTKKLTKKVTITVAGEEGITATLTNPLSSEYPNTVLVNQQAVIKVQVVESGKPVAGRTLVATLTNKNDVQHPNNSKYDFAGNNSTAVTDANGIATFVIGNTTAGVKASTPQYASINFKVQDAVNSKTVEGSVDFATVTTNDIVNLNNWKLTDDIPNLVPGVNYVARTNKGVAKTVSMDEPGEIFNPASVTAKDEFVESQQVSSADKDEHKVGFRGGYPVITLPDSASDLSTASKKVEEINHKSEAYHTYANDSYYYTLKEKPSKLTYATINFDNVTISKYTSLVVETFKSEADAKAATTVPSVNSLDKKEYKGELAQSSFAYQVPLDQGYEGEGLCVKVTLKSEGQVDTAKNAGYNVKNITYVYRTNTTVKGAEYPLKGATIEWAIVDTPMTAEEDIFTNNDGDRTTTTIGDATITVPAKGKITKKVPAFPYTGTAVLTVYDANGKVVNYYACATKNTADIPTGDRYGANPKYVNNTNDIYKGASCYEISVDELRDKVGEIVSQDANGVWVDSKKSGRTTLEGTIKVDGKDLKLDAETNTVYTSIQWNPIPKQEVTTSEAFVALLGQKIEVIAQLVDKNGNAVTLPNKGIKFKENGDEVTGTVIEGTVTNVANAKASIIQLDKNTDSKGQAKLILKASDVTEITNITAVAESAEYDVVLKVADKTVTQADLYWVDADLAFVNEVGATAITTTTTKTNEVVPESLTQPKVGETWEYGVKTVGTVLAKADGYIGALAGKTINIANLGITMAKTTDSVGTVETNTGVNGMVKATSTKAATTKIVSAIDSKTLTDKVTVDAGVFAGVGAPTIKKKLTLNVKWKNDGMSAEVVTPVGTRILGNSTVVYVKVADAYGNPAPTGTKVTFKDDDTSATLTGQDSEGKVETTTTADGIAKVTLNKGTSPRTTVVATVDGITDNVFTQTYTWITAADIARDLKIDDNLNDTTQKYQTVFNKDAKTITMKFTEEILESSVVKEEFTVTYDPATGDDVVYEVSEATVDGDTITLKLADVPASVGMNDGFEVAIKPATVKGIDYLVTSIDGVMLHASETTITFKADSSDKLANKPQQTGYSQAKSDLDIAADAQSLVTALTTETAETDTAKIKNTITAGGTNSSAYAYTELTDDDNILVTDGEVVSLLATIAGKTATFKVEISNGTGTPVTKTFKVTVNETGTAYKVELQ